MFLKGKDKDLSKRSRVFVEDDLENINLNDKADDFDFVNLDDEREAQIEQLFRASTVDTSKADKIIIRDIEPRAKKVKTKKSSDDVFLASEDKPKKKVRRRVKKTSPKAEKAKAKKEKKKYTKPEYEYAPLASDSDYNPVDSDFRAKSMDWKDPEYKADYSGLDDLKKDFNVRSFDEDSRSATPLRIVAAALALIMFVSAVMTTNVYAKLECADRKADALSRISSYEMISFEQVASEVEEIEAPISLEEAKPNIYKVLSLVLSSVEKDLKIKLVDEDETLVKNEPWSVTITDGEGNESQEEDDDQDGIIHVTDISAGDYSVTLNPSDNFADYEIPTVAQTVSVKAKVEYKVIADIKEEIKSEKEINAAVEDANGNQAADVEVAAPITDTVEWLESTKTAMDGEAEYVEATPDLTKTAKADTSKLSAFLDNLKLSAKGRVATPLALKTFYRADEEGEEKTGETAHEHDWGSDGNAKTCLGCGIDNPNYKAPHEHKYGDDGKAEKCDCGEPNPNYQAPHEHKYGNDGKAEKCECGEKNPNYKAPHTHSFGEWTSDGNGKHSRKCTGDGCTEKETANCTYGNDGKAEKCSTCGAANPNYKKPAEEIHEYKYTSTNDGKHNAVCSVANCTTHKAIAAEVCTYKDGVCTKCNAKQVKKEEATLTLSGKAEVAEKSSTVITATMTPAGTIKLAAAEDSSIITVAVDGMKITVQGVKVGSTKLNVEDSNGSKASITITVKTADKYDDNAQLYDALKNPLYVKDGDTYRLAKYKDYRENPNQKFYRKQEAFLYTGWQTIDGKRYYFDRNNKPVTGDQIIGGVKYSFNSEGVLSTGSGSLGIDVSKYQPSINWASVKASGVSYVIIRCGYRGSSTGVLVEDPYFKSHIKGAKAAGLKVGVYFFTTALSEAEAVEEASMAAYLCKGYGIDYPIFMDCESSNRPGYNSMGAGQRTAIIKAFCNTIRSAGYTPGVYANKTWLSSYMNAGELSGYKIWLAQYNANGPTYNGRYDMWQYTSKGKVSGISGNVDMNQSYLGY